MITTRASVNCSAAAAILRLPWLSAYPVLTQIGVNRLMDVIHIVATLNFYYALHRYVDMYSIAEVTSYHHTSCCLLLSAPSTALLSTVSKWHFSFCYVLNTSSWLVTCINKVGGNRCWSVPQDFIQLIRKLIRFSCSACLPIVAFDYLVVSKFLVFVLHCPNQALVEFCCLPRYLSVPHQSTHSLFTLLSQSALCGAKLDNFPVLNYSPSTENIPRSHLINWSLM